MAEWFRHDIGLIGHRKFTRITPKQRDKAKLLYLAALEWVAEHETDGWIPDDALREIGQVAGALRPRVTVAALVETGLFHELSDPAELEIECADCWRTGREVAQETAIQNATSLERETPLLRRCDPRAVRHFYVHGYLERQPFSAKLENDRSAANERQKARRARLAAKGSGDDVSRRDIPLPELGLSRRDTAPLSRDQQVQVQTGTRKGVEVQELDHTRDKPTGRAGETNGTTEHLPVEPPARQQATTATLESHDRAEQILATAATLRGADKGTPGLILALAHQLDPDTAEQALRTAADSSVRNQAGLAVKLLREASRYTREPPTDQPLTDRQRLEQRYAQIADQPDKPVTDLSRSLAHRTWQEAQPVIAGLLRRLPVTADRRRQLLELAEHAHHDAQEPTPA